jgi:uncharacterized repeat protein (TIGR03843 family)
MSAAEDVVLETLATRPLEVLGRAVSASNATLLCRVGGDSGMLAVYKPAAGEAPLWDFPPRTLHRREVAAFVVDRALGWGMVPETAQRRDGPHGPGSVQLFVEHDPDDHYFTLVSEPDGSVQAQLMRMVVFDIIANNTDRKGGHVLRDRQGRLWLVDHGVCFHRDDKLRTVAWDFAGEPVPEELRADAAALADRLGDAADGLRERLVELLSPEEVEAVRWRARRAAASERFPAPSGARPYPWPPI